MKILILERKCFYFSYYGGDFISSAFCLFAFFVKVNKNNSSTVQYFSGHSIRYSQLNVYGPQIIQTPHCKRQLQLQRHEETDTCWCLLPQHQFPNKKIQHIFVNKTNLVCTKVRPIVCCRLHFHISSLFVFILVSRNKLWTENMRGISSNRRSTN